MLVFPKKAASLIESNERTINDSLMQLVCRPPYTYLRPSRNELVDVLEEIADLRCGSEPSYPRPAGFYSGPLYWDVFGCDPVGNVAYRLERLKQRYREVWIDCDPKKMADALRQFYTVFADGCQDQQMDRMSISSLIDRFIDAVCA
jgi:hypothetical protein